MKNSKSEKKMKQETKENQNQERYNATVEIVDFDILYYFKSEMLQMIEDLVELKNLAYYANEKDFKEHRKVCVYLLNSLAESLQQGAQNLEEFT